MVNLTIDYAQVGTFLAILLRLSLILFVLPFFGSNDLPKSVKALIALALALVLYLFLYESVAPLSFEPITLLKVAVGEMVFAAVVSLAILIVFGAFHFAGEIIGFQMGFGFAQVADPQTGAQVMVISQFFQLLATLIFFSLNGHHMILSALVDSFRTMPVGGFMLTTGTYDKLLFLSGKLFVIGIKMAAPLMAVFFLTQVGLGLVARFSPEINILMVSFPLTILLGFVFIALSTSIWGDAMAHSFGLVFQLIRDLAH